MPTYRPEGLQNQPIPTPEVLRRAGGSREIFQAMCIKCDEFHNLVVDLGCLRGLIPREETALGIADGSAREIAILSRVGKPVCFQVLGFTSDGTVLLTRRGAQAEALDYFFTHLQPGDILPAVVQNPASFGTFCDIGCGVTALMSIERCSVSRINAGIIHTGRQRRWCRIKILYLFRCETEITYIFSKFNRVFERTPRMG